MSISKGGENSPLSIRVDAGVLPGKADEVNKTIYLSMLIMIEQYNNHEEQLRRAIRLSTIDIEPTSVKPL